MTGGERGRELPTTENRVASVAVVDCHCVKSAAMVSQAVGYDAAKQVKPRDAGNS